MKRHSLPLLTLASLSLVATILPGTPVLAAPAPGKTPVPGALSPSVPGRGAPAVARQGPDPDQPAPDLAAPSWPAAASATVAVSSSPVRVAGMPVTLSAAPGGSAAAGAASAAPVSVRAENLAHDKVVKLGSGAAMALVLRRTDDAKTSTGVRLTVDYSKFAQAFGGDYAGRLRLMRLPDGCAADPAGRGCVDGVPVSAKNNPVAGTLSAAVDVAGEPAVFAVVSLSSSSGGDYRATDLNDSAKWIAGSPGGSFSYSYPIELPPPPYGEAPKLALSYNSGTVDGRTAKSNNQPSWVGQGWNIDLPAIERHYKSCSDDGYPSWGDLCWASPYSGDPAAALYTITINGHSSELLKAADGTYRMRDDQSYKIEHRTGGPNDDNDGEYWIVSTLDGVQYFLGYGQDSKRSVATKTNSNWAVNVISDDAGEPCHQSDLASCKQTYRWNVDQMHDENENYAIYFYETEANTYRRASSGNDLTYVRGGYLSKIEYGKTDTVDAPAPAYVSFTHYNRCKQRTTVPEPDLNPPADCPTIASSPSSYPDVPADLICSSGCSKHSPSFFITDWLDSISAYVRNSANTGYDLVTKYQLKYGFPATGDGSLSSLWLDYIRRIGYVGGTIREAVTSFDGINLNNRVDYNTGLGVRPGSMRRLLAVHNEFGGETKVAYGHQPQRGCFTAGTAASGWSTWYNKKEGHWDTNTDECYPVYFKPEGSDPGFGIFHKYVVLSVTGIDHVGGQPDQLTSFTYLGGAAWHHDDDLLAPSSAESWGDWRGYGDVQVTNGSGPNTQRTVTTTTYFRGMDADVLVSGARSIYLSDYDTPTNHATYRDAHFMVGRPLQKRSYRLNDDGSTTEVASERWVYWESGITANGPGLHNAHIVQIQQHLSRDLLDNGAWRVSEQDFTYDSYGVETSETDLGDLAVATDTVCTTTTYARNMDDWRWMINYPETIEEHQGSCTGPVMSRTVNLYDGATSTDDAENKPYDGNPTEVHTWTDASTEVVYKHTYDLQGREKTETDPLGKTTTTTYVPAEGYPTGGVTETNVLGHTTITFPNPAFGQPSRVRDAGGRITESDYDALGRLVAVWLPNRPRSGGVPSYTYAYATPATGITSPTGPTLVTTKQLQSGTTAADAVWLASYDYQDGFGRSVENQVPSPQAGGRAVTVTRYDSRGLTVLTSQPMYNSAAAGSGLLNPAENAIPQYGIAQYDWLKRKSADITKAAGVELWRTATEYHGDHTVTIPPTGAQVVTWTNVAGKPTTMQSYLDGITHHDTSYTYYPDDNLATITDPNGNVTRYTYDWLGHKLTATDPDSGGQRTSYDPLGRVSSTTDGKGQKLSIEYDAIGREIRRWAGDINTGTKLTEKTYDVTPLPGGAQALGQLSSDTRYVNGQAYTSTITGYDNLYNVSGRKWTIPSTETGLGGTYEFGYTYDAAGHPISMTYPAAGGLPAETVTEHYTNLGLVDTLTGVDNYVTAATYSGSLNLVSRTYGTMMERRYDYEPTTNRLSAIKTLVKGATVQDDGYTYDQANNVKSVTDRVAGQNQCYGYDGRQRLITAYTNATGCTSPADANGPDPYKLAYSYDGAGNITASTSNGVTTNYSYPAQGTNSVRPHAVTTVGANSYGYDANGNMTSRTAGGVNSTFAYGAENDLASVTSGGKTSSFVYDADGDRLIRRDSSGRTLFIDGTELTVGGTGAATATRYYTSGGATVAVRTAAGLTWLTADQQGSEQLAVNATSGAVSRQRYLPYGAPRGAGNRLPTDRGFLGKVTDGDSGLVLLGARYYDPSAGRFLTPDPLDNNAEPGVANPYAYAANNPVTFSDPTGLKPADCNAACMVKWGKQQAARARKSHYSSGSSRSSGSSAGHSGRRHVTRHYPGCYVASRGFDYCGSDGRSSFRLWHPDCYIPKAKVNYCGSSLTPLPRTVRKSSGRPNQMPELRYYWCKRTGGSDKACNYARTMPEPELPHSDHQFVRVKGCWIGCGEVVHDEDGYHLGFGGEYGVGKLEKPSKATLKTGAMGSVSVGSYTAKDRKTSFGGCFYYVLGGCFYFGTDSRNRLWTGLEVGAGWGMSGEIDDGD